MDNKIKELQMNIRDTKQDIADFQQTKNLKAWLRIYQMQHDDRFYEGDEWDVAMRQGFYDFMRS